MKGNGQEWGYSKLGGPEDFSKEEWMNVTCAAQCPAAGKYPAHAVTLTNKSIIIYFCYIQWSSQPESGYNYLSSPFLQLPSNGAKDKEKCLEKTTLLPLMYKWDIDPEIREGVSPWMPKVSSTGGVTWRHFLPGFCDLLWFPGCK